MKTISFITCFLLIGILPLPGWAKEEKSVDDDIEQIEESLSAGSYSRSNRYFGPVSYGTSATGLNKFLPDISVIGTFAGAYFTKEPGHYEEHDGEDHEHHSHVGHDPARTGFTLQEIEVAFQSYIDPYFRADIFLGFHEDGVELEEGYATTLGLVKGLQIRAGKMLLPFGRQNQKHLEVWDFADNTLVNGLLLGGHGLSEIGLEVAYTFPTPFFLQLQGTFTNGDNDEILGGNRKQDFLYQGRVVASFDLSENTSLLIGGSGALGFNHTGEGNQTRLIGGDVYFKWKPSAYRAVSWQTEYIYRYMELVDGSEKDGGLYSYVDYQFGKRWHAGVRYDQVGLPTGHVSRRFRVTPAITFNPTEYSRIRLQYEWDKERGHESEHAAILQFEFNMGPHGAHPF